MNDVWKRYGVVLALTSLAWTACDSPDPIEDAGPAVTDAGPLEDDAGPQTDAGPIVDAGPQTDAGSDAGPEVDAGLDGGPAPTECSTAITAADAAAFVELCALEGPARHVRIDGVLTPAVHASAQVVFGFGDGEPASATEELADDQMRVLLYGGGTPFPPAALQASFGAITETLDGNASFLNSLSTVCFDVHPGGVDGAPAFALWIDGERGADCDDRSTLTIESASSIRSWWRGASGAIDDAAPIYYRQASSVTSEPTVTLSVTPALEASAIEAAAACVTSFADHTGWQPLCAPAAGEARHIRVDGVETTANNSYFYVVLGEAADPTGAPEGGEGKLIITGGRSHSGASWTWLRFGEDSGDSTMPAEYAAGSDPLYTSGPTTICMDVGEDDEGNARVLLWASGASGADCDDGTTLTAEAALYDSEADAITGAIWDAALASGMAFVKTNNGTVTLGDVTVRHEAAAL